MIQQVQDPNDSVELPDKTKYSRFHSRPEFSIWCNSPIIKYTESFRDLILQINPFCITCVYKKMFETCATNNLRLSDDDGPMNEERDTSCPVGNPSQMPVMRNGGSHSEPTTPRPGESVDKSNSCVYGTANNSTTAYNRYSNSLKHNFCGWGICVRAHSASCTGYQNITSDENRDLCRRQGKSACYRVNSPKTFPSTLRNIRSNICQHGDLCRYGSPSLAILSRKTTRDKADESTGSQSSSSNTTVIVSPIKVGKRFKHFKQNDSYMEQYREEYTYRKLKENRDTSAPPQTVDAYICSCGNHTCAGSNTSSSCIQKWYPNQSHHEKPNTAATCEKDACVTSGVPVPKRTPVLKKRPAKPPPKRARVPVNILAPKQDDATRKKNQFVWSKQDGRKVGLFATSLRVNNYNPTKTTSAYMRSSSSTQPVLQSGSLASINVQNAAQCPQAPLPAVCQTFNQNVKGKVD